MTKRIIIFLYITFSTLLSIVSLGQENQYTFHQIGTKDGLSQSQINDITQDCKGFMWFATSEGLNRFDGNEFKTYLKNKNTNSLPDSYINCISIDSTAIMWIGTAGSGLVRFDLKNNTFDSFRIFKGNTFHESDCITDMIDIENNIWISSYLGLHRLDKKTLKFESYYNFPENKNSLPDNFVRKIYRTNDGNIWIITLNHGLSKYNPQNNSFDTYDIPDKRYVNAICENKVKNDGKLWIGTNKGLLVFDTKTKSFDEFEEPILTSKLNKTFINELLIDKKGNLWIGTRKEGLYVFQNNENNKILHFVPNKWMNYSINSYQILSLFEDNKGSIWVGTYSDGINIAYKNQFENICLCKPSHKNNLTNKINNIYIDAENQIWAATENGLLKTNEHFEITQQILHDDNAPDMRISAICEFPTGTLWIGTKESGLFKFDKHSGKISNIEKTDNLRINDIKETNNKIWATTDKNGLFCINPQTNKTINYQNNRTQNSLITNKLNVLQKTKNGKIWIGTSGFGLELFDIDTEKFTNYSALNRDDFDGKYILSLHADDDDCLWIGTHLEGLYKYDPNSNKFTNYSIKDGLINNVINAISEDSEKCLWLSTNKGISRFNKINADIANFQITDGLQQTEFRRNSSFKDKTGKIYFGGNFGITAFHPDKIFNYTLFPEVIISNINTIDKINDKTITDLATNISYTEKIIISKNDYIFSIDFIAPYYKIQDKLHYSYKLDGFDKEWHTTSNIKRTATYTNLPAGEYVFKVKASTTKEIWDETETQLKIKIKQNLREIIWLKILAGLLIGSLIFAWIYNKTKKIKNKIKVTNNLVQIHTTALELKTEEIEKQKEELKKQHDELKIKNENVCLKYNELEERQLQLEKEISQRTKELEDAKNRAEMADKMKTAFLSNMSHEIRTPMNGIIGFVNLLSMENITDEQKKTYIKHINYSSKILLQLIEDIIDIAKLEVGEAQFNKQNINVKDIITDLYKYFEEWRKDQNKTELKIIAQTNNADIIINTDAARLRQILSNLLDNALKFTEKGFIEFGVELIKGFARFFVKDTGVGIAEHDMKVIFDRFRKIQTKNDQLFRGTGLGLTISKKVIEMLGGKIWIESELGKGSCFYFTIPFEKQQKKVLTIEKNKNLIYENIENLNILIVDDEITNFHFLEAALEHTNPKLTWARNGKLAVELVEQNNNYDVILMDLKMPVLDGLKATIMIRNIDKNIPIIAQTAYVMMDEEEKCYQAGCNAYISKPIDIKKLINTICELIDRQNKLINNSQLN